jgi:hypothetical protein
MSAPSVSINMKPCRSFALTGRCRFGLDCRNPHVQQCKFFATGTCSRGDDCHYAHIRAEGKSDVVATAPFKIGGDVKGLSGELGSLKLGRAPFPVESMSATITTETTVVRRVYRDAASAGQSQDCLEVCLCFDTTGSMHQYLEGVRRELDALVRSLLESAGTHGARLRLGVIAHGDYCDRSTSYTIKYLPLLDMSDSGAVSKVLSFVKEVGATGGGDEPECYELALHMASRKMGWGAGALRVLVMVGDSTPHEVGYSCNGYTNVLDWHAELAELARQRVRIYAVQAGRAAGAGRGGGAAGAFWQALADRTEGRRVMLGAAENLAGLVRAAVCRELGEEAFEALGRDLRAKGAMRGEAAYVYEELRTVTVRRTLAARPPSPTAGPPPGRSTLPSPLGGPARLLPPAPAGPARPAAPASARAAGPAPSAGGREGGRGGAGDSGHTPHTRTHTTHTHRGEHGARPRAPSRAGPGARHPVW